MGLLDDTLTFGGRRFNGSALRTGAVLALLGLIGVGEGLRLGADPDANRLHQSLLPGMYVLALGAIVLGSGLIHVWRNAEPASAGPARPDASLRQVVALLLCLAAYALLIERLGYELASAPFFLAVLRVFGVRSWVRTAVLSLVFTMAFYLLFVRYLGVILPRGLLEGIV